MAYVYTNMSSKHTPDENSHLVSNQDLRSQSKQGESVQGSFGPLSCYAVTLNCTVGTGAFGLPYAFSVTGYVLTTIILMVGALMNYIGNSYVLSFLSRTEAIMMKREKDETENPSPLNQVHRGSVIMTAEGEISNVDGTFNDFYQDSDPVALSPNGSCSPRLDHENHDIYAKLASDSFVFRKDWEKPNYDITFRKFDFTMISRLFGGVKCERICFISMFLYCFGTLWAYSSVFPSSAATLYFSYVKHEQCDVFAEHVSSDCNLSYYIFQAIYAFIVVTLSIMNMSEAVMVQNVLALYRVVAFSIMLITLSIKISVDGSSAVERRLENMSAFSWSHFANGFGTILLSCCCAYNIPDLVQPLDNKKKYGHTVVTASLVTSAIVYFFLGILGSVGFDRVSELCTLDWASYSGCGNGWDRCMDDESTGEEMKKICATFVQLIVMLFPPICVTSSFPIVCMTMAENMEGVFKKAYSKAVLDRIFCGKFSVLSRLFIAIPPIILAAIFKKLSVIFTLSGLFGFVLSIIIPCYLEYVSIKAVKTIWQGVNVEKTPFDTRFSTERVSISLSAIGIVFLGVAAYAFIHDRLF